jgi:hypothetical protein
MQRAGLFQSIALEWHSQHKELLLISQKLASKAIRAATEELLDRKRRFNADKSLVRPRKMLELLDRKR